MLSIQFENRVRTKLELPGTEHRLRLIIESDPQEIDPDTLEENLFDTQDSSANYIIGLEGEHLRGDWQFRPSVGIRARWPPELYARLRATRYFDLNPWLARVSGNASWFSADGVSLAATTDFDRRLNDTLLFRASSNARCIFRGQTTNACKTGPKGSASIAARHGERSEGA